MCDHKGKQYDLFDDQDDDCSKIVSIVPKTPEHEARYMVLEKIRHLGMIDEPVTIENYRDNLLNFADVLEESIAELISLDQSELKASIEKQAMVAARLRHRFR